MENFILQLVREINVPGRLIKSFATIECRPNLLIFVA